MSTHDSAPPPEHRPNPDIHRDPLARTRIPLPAKGQFATPQAAGLTRPKVRLAETSGNGMPLGASIQTPVPTPLPERGSGIFFALNLAAAIIAVIFAIQIALKF